MVNKLTKIQKDNAKIAEIMKARKAAKAIAKAAKETAPIVEKEVVLGNTGEKAGSRADLMAQAKNMGIKYFRILTRDELEIVLTLHVQGGKAPDGRTFMEIIDQAKARWKAGWTNGVKKNAI